MQMFSHRFHATGFSLHLLRVWKQNSGMKWVEKGFQYKLLHIMLRVPNTSLAFPVIFPEKHMSYQTGSKENVNRTNCLHSITRNQIKSVVRHSPSFYLLVSCIDSCFQVFAIENLLFWGVTSCSVTTIMVTVIVMIMKGSPEARESAIFRREYISLGLCLQTLDKDISYRC